MNDERWRHLGFREGATTFQSQSQNARVWTEGWVHDNVFCPACGATAIRKLPNNSPVADFSCDDCSEQFELKSQRTRFGARVVDGAYKTMTARLLARDNPNLLLMRYDRAALSVTDLIVVPKHFFTPLIIEPRKPLAPTARRAGWQGCNILLSGVPNAGRIWLVKDRVLLDPQKVQQAWKDTLFLRDQTLAARGWLVEVLRCVEAIPSDAFSLQDVYAFEASLRERYPANANVRPKIRQQLQVLRDKGLVEFLGGGRYRKLRLN